MPLKGGGGVVSKNVTQQFLLVISLVKVDKKCHMEGWGGGGWGGFLKVQKKCHVLLEWPLRLGLVCFAIIC